MLKYIHYNNHIKKIGISKVVFNMDYYWAGYTENLMKIIKKYWKFHSEYNVEKIPYSSKIIYSYWPHKRYQCDIWYLKGDLKNNNNYEYVMDIIDHYSKWLDSYLLRNKTAPLFLSYIKKYLMNIGICQIFQTDNGSEFNNQILKIFL